MGKKSTVYDATKEKWEKFKTKENIRDELKQATDAGKGKGHGFANVFVEKKCFKKKN